jgi:hypothetical protein
MDTSVKINNRFIDFSIEDDDDVKLIDFIGCDKIKSADTDVNNTEKTNYIKKKQVKFGSNEIKDDIIVNNVNNDEVAERELKSSMEELKLHMIEHMSFIMEFRKKIGFVSESVGRMSALDKYIINEYYFSDYIMNTMKDDNSMKNEVYLYDNTEYFEKQHNDKYLTKKSFPENFQRLVLPHHEMNEIIIESNKSAGLIVIEVDDNVPQKSVLKTSNKKMKL